jgi:molybdopterin/thiamine biosynthesis adenylyltransferase
MLDLAELLGANGLDGCAPLVRKRVILIGCGAIGGYLARMLAQLGAGLEAKFILIDCELLSHPNIRRHQLGLSGSLRNKAEACAEAITLDFPGLEIEGVKGDVKRHVSLLAGADLVIDATGEQGLSEWLNHWALEQRRVGEAVPALQFVWIAGAGAAAQSFFVIDNRYACYRCLQPDTSKPARFDPLRELSPAPVAACGDDPSTLYGPAAPAAAASLAAVHASDWASDHPHALLRTARIDWKATVKRDPKSPERVDDCPACGKR